MYLLSVVSNVNVKRKTPIMIFLYTTKITFKNTAHDHKCLRLSPTGVMATSMLALSILLQ